MKVYEVVEKLSIKTTKADVAKMKDINARMQQAARTGDADAGFRAGAELGDILQNKLYPDLLAVGAYIVNELEKACAKYSKKDPKWNQACKELPQTKMAILKQIHGQGLKPFQGSKKSGEKIVNIFGKSYVVPAAASTQNVGETATSGATSAGAIAAVPGNGFANGGPGTLTRAGTIPNKKQKKNKKKN